MADEYDDHSVAANHRMDEAALAALAAYLREKFPGSIPQPQPTPVPPVLPEPEPEPGPPTTPSGFTVIPYAKVERLIHVDEDGNDTLAGATRETAVATPERAKQLVRDDHPGDWIAFKKGGAWNMPMGRWKWSGAPDIPRVITSYGNGPRPIFNLNGANWVNTDGGSGTPDVLDHIWFIGLELRGDGTHSGFRWLQSSTGSLFEDMKVSGFDDGFVLQGYSGGDKWHHDMTVRRCIIHDNFSTDNKSQGLYASQVDGLEIVECVLDRNGRNGNSTVYSHDLYIQTSNSRVAVRGCLLSRSAAHGLQLRPGGILENTLVMGNGVGVLLKEDSTVRDVVMTGSRDPTHPRLTGWGVDLDGISTASVNGLASVHGGINAHHGVKTKNTPPGVITGTGNYALAWGDTPVIDEAGVLPNGFFATPGPGAELDRVLTLDTYPELAISRGGGQWDEAASPASQVKWVLDGLRA